MAAHPPFGVMLLAAALVLPCGRGQQALGQTAQQPEATQPRASWESFPLMVLERVYRGPLRDTVIQRWRDPVDGSVCHLYIPISAPLLPPVQNGGFAQYGPNTIGSISCSHPTQVVQLVSPRPVPQAAPSPPPQPARDGRPRR